MAKKIEIIDHALVVTDTITGKIELDKPTKDMWYTINKLDEGIILFIEKDGSTRNYTDSKYIILSDAVNSSDVAFNATTFRAFVRLNLGFNSASGGSGAGASQVVYGFTDLVAGIEAGELAYVETSEGTAWLPGTIGGTYYPKGWYLWSGSAWTSDRNAIAEELNQAVLASEVSIIDTGALTVTTEVESYLAENRTAINLNTIKNTNVPTALSAGTINATSYGITSDGGVDDIVLSQAIATTSAGLLSGADKSKLDGIEVNAKDDPIASDVSILGGGLFTAASEVEAALQENRTEINLRAPKESPQFTGRITLRKTGAGVRRLSVDSTSDNFRFISELDTDGTGGKVLGNILDDGSFKATTKLIAGNDDQLYLNLAGGNGILSFDANDFLFYDRTTNKYSFRVGGVDKFTIDSAGNIASTGGNILGAGAPSIKMKKITGTTGAAQGNMVSVPHGLTSSKIIGFQVIVHYTTELGMIPGMSDPDGYEYSSWYDVTNFVLKTHLTNSANILSKPFTILITYEA